MGVCKKGSDGGQKVAYFFFRVDYSRPFAFQTDSLIEDLRRYVYAESLVCHCVRRSGCDDGEYGCFDAHHQHQVVLKDRRKDLRTVRIRSSERRLLTRGLFFFALKTTRLMKVVMKEEI